MNIARFWSEYNSPGKNNSSVAKEWNDAAPKKLKMPVVIIKQ